MRRDMTRLSPTNNITDYPFRTGDELEDALQEFQQILSGEQRDQLKAIDAIPDAAAVICFTTELDHGNAQRRSRGVATRLHRFLESIQQFSAIVDTFVSSKPNVAALVWGSVKFALLVRNVASNLAHDSDPF